MRVIVEVRKPVGEERIWVDDLRPEVEEELRLTELETTGKHVPKAVWQPAAQ